MAPIYDSDISENRWKDASWRNFELWEKIDRRHQNRRRNWILAAVLLFTILAAVPVWLDRSVRWHSASAIRQLAAEIGQIKLKAALTQHAYALVFTSPRDLEYEIQKLISCRHSRPLQIDSKRLLGNDQGRDFVLMDNHIAKDLNISNLQTQFCYDPIDGFRGRTASAKEAEAPVVGFAIANVNDLAKRRLDRASVLFLKGQSADISFTAQ